MEDIFNQLATGNSLYNTIVVVSTIFFFSCNYVTEGVVYFIKSNKYSSLTRTDQILLITITASSIHAFIVSPMATYALIADTSLHEDYVWGKSKTACIACSITIGYMIADFIHMVLRWRYIGEIGYVFHHAATVIAYLFVIQNECMCFFAMIRLLAEYSTPNVNFRLFLYKMGYKLSSAYFYNGLLMVFSFFTARILILPFYLYTMYSVHGTESLESAGIAKYLLWGSTLVLDTLNLVWLKKMIGGAIKVYNSHKTEDHHSESNGKVKHG